MPKDMWQQWETADDLERDGVWQDFGSFRVRLARAGGANTRFKKEFNEQLTNLRRHLETRSHEEFEKASARVFVQCCVTGWESRSQKHPEDTRWHTGITPPPDYGENGDMGPVGEEGLLPVTERVMLAIFKRLPDLLAHLIDYSEDRAIYQKTLDEDTAGNSPIS